MPSSSPESRRFRFGLILDSRDATRDGVVELARRAEASGIAVLLGTDHLGRWATLPLLQSAAEATGLRIGTFVLNNDLRHPTVLAQELATIDAITDGRLEIGIGAGWNRQEYADAGIPFDAPGERVTRMQATVAMVKQALSEGRIDHEADTAYPAIHQDGLPTSVQRPHPPIMIGGGGPRVLRHAAREADIIGIDPRAGDPNDITEAAVYRKIAWIREAAGDRWSQLEINIALFELDPDYHTRTGPRPPRARGISEAQMPGSPHYLVGDASEMIDTLRERRERWGISYIAIRPEQLDSMSPIMSVLA